MAIFIRKNSKLVYEVRKCLLSDIDSDYEYIKDNVLDTPEEVYKDNMVLSVKSGLSYRYKCCDGSFGFIYTYTKNKEGYASSIYNSGSILGFIILFYELFNNYPARYIYVQPHNLETVKMLKSLAEGYSIRNWHIYKDPLIIMLDKNKRKYKKIFLDLGFKKL